VLTEDDIMTLPNPNYANTAQRNGNTQPADIKQKTDTMRFANGSSIENKQPGVEHLNSEHPTGILPEDEHEIDELPAGGHPGRNISRAAVIVITIIACFALIGTGMYFFIRSPGSQKESMEPVISEAGTKEDTDQSDNERNLILPSSHSITTINILSDGRIQTEFHTMVNETVLLRARIVPEGIDVDIVWTSSDPEVLDVISLDQKGHEAHITGKAAGVADIILTAGSFEVSYPVFIDNNPMDLQLETAIADSDTPIWLTISWTSGQLTGQDTVFERAPEDQAWTMESITLRGEVEPAFGRENNIFTISFPDEERMYYLFSDGLGHLSKPDGTEKDEFTWGFKTTLIEAEG